MAPKWRDSNDGADRGRAQKLDRTAARRCSRAWQHGLVAASHHARKNAIASDQAMKKRRSKMRKEGREQRKSKDSVRRPKDRVQTNVLRHDRRQVHRPEKMNWKPASRKHRPADQGHGEQQHIEDQVRRMRDMLL